MKFRHAAVLLFSSLALVAGNVVAQAWPQKPIRIIVTFSAAGGSSDIVARLITQPLAEKLGPPVIVDSRPGAGATIGAAAVAQAQVADRAPAVKASGATLI